MDAVRPIQQALGDLRISPLWGQDLIRWPLTAHRVSLKLSKKRARNTPDMWIGASGVYEAVVDTDIIAQAQTAIAQGAAWLVDAAGIEPATLRV